MAPIFPTLRHITLSSLGTKDRDQMPSLASRDAGVRGQDVCVVPRAAAVRSHQKPPSGSCRSSARALPCQPVKGPMLHRLWRVLSQGNLTAGDAQAFALQVESGLKKHPLSPAQPCLAAEMPQRRFVCLPGETSVHHTMAAPNAADENSALVFVLQVGPLALCSSTPREALLLTWRFSPPGSAACTIILGRGHLVLRAVACCRCAGLLPCYRSKRPPACRV